MDVIMVADIFGRTEHLEALVRRVTPDGLRARLLDPYGGLTRTFADEEAAYRAFLSECGHARYARLVRDALDQSGECVLIGFSAGAAAAWTALDGFRGPVRRFLGFYPSRIRDNPDIDLTTPTTLVFPARERHFDVGALMTVLARHETLTCVRTAYAHGFMNPFSPGFDPRGVETYAKVMADCVGGGGMAG
jgi:dienelactone hydrolase